ncbi:hypothetical protein CYMTET_19484 [Cymbomonas tetramitiformis]|uniref:Phosphoglycerate dehydrogenase n=1 Tax=Cymbomonas tetramitiformis TaxID=36881 RepID=A0AAE0G6I3_9CHLO|nr:hypothetical protein CYMTET_19484 [Cymbomonas tetramitiformis]
MELTMSTMRPLAKCAVKITGPRVSSPSNVCPLRSKIAARVPGGVRASRRFVVKAVASMPESDEISLMKRLLELAEERERNSSAPAPAAAEGDYSGPTFNIQTFNAISAVGLERYDNGSFGAGRYSISGDVSELPGEPMAIMLRSHKLQVDEVAPTVRAIARCGAGTNNIPVAEMTELGIPVFNTPGANANSVMELVMCALLLTSRGILEGARHVEEVIVKEENGDHEKVAKRIEKDKSKFVGQELRGKTLGVIGLGQIGSRVVNAALAMGMKVVGYDPVLSVEAAWNLPGDRMTRATTLKELLSESDYLTIHVPYIKDVTHHMLNAETISYLKPNVHIINLARGEIVDGEIIASKYEDGTLTGKYISDFADPFLQDHPRFITLPHLGASTEEAEENAAAMAADEIMDFLETGTIRNSVNFPNAIMEPKQGAESARLCIVHKSTPGTLGKITTCLGDLTLNITQQINVSRGSIAYTVIDMETAPAEPDAMQNMIAAECDDIISTRFIGNPYTNELGTPGTYYYVRWAGQN